MVSSPLSVFKCPNCDHLKSKILEQISAFKVLAKVNAALNWTILVENLEGLLARQNEEIVEIQSGPHPEGQEIKQDTIDEDVPNDDFIRQDDENVDEILENYKIQDIDNWVNNSDNNLTAAKLEAANEFMRRKPVSGNKKKKFEYECLICHHASTSQRDTKLHIRRVHFMDRFQCTECHSKFYDLKNLASHRCTSCIVIPKEPPKKKAKKKTVKKKKLTRKKLRRKYKEKKVVCEDDQCEILTTNSNNNNNDLEQEAENIKEENDGQTDMAIKHDAAFDMEVLIVTNPFENFNLKQALSAQVQLDRMDYTRDQPPVPSFDLVAATTSALEEYNCVPNDADERDQKKSEKQQHRSKTSKSKKPSLRHSIPGPRRTTISKKMKLVQRKNYKKSKSGHQKKVFVATYKIRKETKRQEEEIDPLKTEIVNDEPVHFLSNCEPVLLGQNKHNDDLMLENIKIDPSQYQDLPRLTVNIYDTADGYENDMMSDMPNLSPPLLTPVNVRDLQEPEIKLEDDDDHDMLPVETVMDSDGDDQQDEANDDDEANEPEHNSLVPFNPSNNQLLQPEISGERASLDQVDTIIVAKVDLSNKNGGVTFHCTLCPKVYKDVTTIRRHVRLVHFMERKPCGICGKNFYDHTRRRKHEENCTGKG